MHEGPFFPGEANHFESAPDFFFIPQDLPPTCCLCVSGNSIVKALDRHPGRLIIYFEALNCTFILHDRYMDRGKFVPDHIIFKVLAAAIKQAKGRGKHILVDGFPR